MATLYRSETRTLSTPRRPQLEPAQWQQVALEIDRRVAEGPRTLYVAQYGGNQIPVTIGCIIDALARARQFSNKGLLDIDGLEVWSPQFLRVQNDDRTEVMRRAASVRTIQKQQLVQYASNEKALMLTAAGQNLINEVIDQLFGSLAMREERLAVEEKKGGRKKVTNLHVVAG